MNDLTCIMSPAERALDTLTAFVRDTEHDLLSVVTALQAHIDLLHDELVRNHIPVERFAVLNRAVARLITDTTVLASIADIARIPRSKETLVLDSLMQEIAQETRAAFSKNQVSLSYDIAKGTTLVGDSVPLKAMIMGMVLAVLHKCPLLETVRVVGLTDRNRVTLSFDIGMEANKGVFKPWRLGELRLAPTNGEGVSLAAVDSIARLHRGHLSVSSSVDRQPGYKLTFRD